MMKKMLSTISLLLVSSGAMALEMSDEGLHCLALNSYFEARNQSPNGAIAVTQVVLNRVGDSRYPSTICEVVKQGKQWPSGAMKRNQCQFSWYCDGLSDKPRDEHAWYDAWYRTITAIEMYKAGYDLTYGSTHYHAKNVKPYWSTTIDYITTIDDHHFYRWGE